MSDITLLNNGLQLDCARVKAYFNYYWLRDNCPSSWDPVTQERVFDILAAPDDLKVQNASMDTHELVIAWSDDHVSHYSLDWLARWAEGTGHGDLAVRTRKPWYSDHYANMARFDFTRLVDEPATVADWTEALLDEGIALVSGMPDSDQGLSQLCELVGTVRASFSGYAFDVRSKADPVNLAYTTAALELHTDLPPEELAPGIQFLHCRVNDARGGDSLFVDATAVANDLKRSYPQAFKILTQQQASFRYTTSEHDVRAHQHIIELDPNNGEVSGINFSQHLSDVFDLDQHVMDDFYPAFRRFGKLMQDPKYLMTFRLHAGECIVFDNHRIAHGRTSYEKGSGDRHLRGCYVDRGELRSKYRVLRARYPKPATA